MKMTGEGLGPLNLSLYHTVWGLGSVPRQVTYLGTLHKPKAKGSQGEELPTCHFS